MLSHGHRYLGRNNDHMQSCMGTHAWLMRTRLVSCILNTALKLEAELWEMNRSDSWAASCPPPQGSLRHVIACIVSFSVTLAFPLPQKHHMVPDTKWPQWTYSLLLCHHDWRQTRRHSTESGCFTQSFPEDPWEITCEHERFPTC